MKCSAGCGKQFEKVFYVGEVAFPLCNECYKLKVHAGLRVARSVMDLVRRKLNHG